MLESIPVHTRTHGIGTKFKYGNHAGLFPDSCTQTSKRGLDGSRMMGKVIVHHNLFYRSPDFKTTLDVPEAGQGLDGNFGGNFCMMCCSNGCQCIVYIMDSEQIPAYFTTNPFFMQYFKCTSILFKTF